MRKRINTFGLGTQEISQLLRVASEEMPEVSRTAEKDDMGAALRERLAEHLPPDAPALKSLPEQLGDLKTMIATLASETLSELLADSKTPIEAFIAVKDHAKRWSKTAQSQASHHSANALYYAAIAGALVFRQQKITKFADEDLRQSFTQLRDTKWIPGKLRRLFDAAGQSCQRPSASPKDKKARRTAGGRTGKE